MIARLLSLIALAILCAVQAAAAQTKPKLTDVGIEGAKSSIFIGNSFFYYNNSMHAHVLALDRTADPKNRAAYRSTSVTISGSGFDGTTPRAISGRMRSGVIRSMTTTTSSSTSSTSSSTSQS